MDTSTLAPPAEAEPAPCDAPPVPEARSGLAAEVRESLMLLGFAVGVTVGLTTAAQAALALLG
jgi:hypothetical protein